MPTQKIVARTNPKTAKKVTATSQKKASARASTATNLAKAKAKTKLKQEIVWLKEPDKCSLQNSLKQLDAAYQNFFKRIEAGYPKFKSKKNRHKSYKTNRINKWI